MNEPHEFSSGKGTGWSRRRFLAGALGTGVVAPLTRSLWAAVAASGSWKMKLSTSSLHYRSLSVQQACQRIGSLGFEAIDIWSHFEWAGPVCEHLEEAVLQMGPDAFAKLLDRHHLRLGTVSCYTAPLSRFASQLGELGGCVVVRGSTAVAPDASGAELPNRMKAFFESLKPDLELAEKNHCTLAIENHSGNSLLNQLDSFKAFTDYNTNPRLGIALAPYHVQLNHESVEDAIRLAGSQLTFFYAWQHAEGTRQLPGIGDTDVVPWLRALASINYSGDVNPFMHHEPEPAAMDDALAKSRASLLAAHRKTISS